MRNENQWQYNLAQNNEKFINSFEADINEDIDLSMLLGGSRTGILFTDEYGEILSTTVEDAFVSRDGYIPRISGHEKDVPRVTEFKQFMKLYPHADNETINIDIQPYNSYKMVYFPNAQGKLEKKPIRIIINELMNKTVDYDSYILDDAHFWSVCVDYDKKEELRYSHKETRNIIVRVKCQKCGKEYYTSVYCVFHSECLCDQCKKDYISPEMVDKDIAAFYADSKSLSLINIVDKRQYQFICPYCGYHFKRGMVYMVGKKPKCPACYDNGQVLNSISENTIDDNEPFLIFR